MNSRLTPHLAWLVVATAAFTLGRLTSDGPDTEAKSPSSLHKASSEAPTSAFPAAPEGDLSTVSGKDTRSLPADTTATLAGASEPRTGTTVFAATEKPEKTLVERAAEAMLMGSDLRRQRTFLALLEEMKPEDAVAIRSFLAKSTDQGVVYENLWEQFWTRWGEIDGPGAMKYILETQTHESVPKDIARVMRGWGAIQPEEAAQWLEEHQDKGNLGAGLIGLTDGYASENLSGATSLALAAAPSGDPLLGKLMETLAEQAVRQGRLHGLTSWFNQLPASSEPGSARAAALGHVYWRLWQADHDTALDWVQQQSSTPWRSDRIVGEIAQRVAGTDPAKAFTWLQSVPPSPKDGSYPGIGGVVGAWFRKDPGAATQALQSLPAGAFKDQAIASQNGMVRGGADSR